jgi:hypothetical protein
VPKIAVSVERLERWLDNRKLVILLTFSLIYLIGTIAACSRPFWYDEFFTLEIAKSNSASGVIDALNQGMDRTPPTYHLLNWFVTRAAGVGKVGLRAVSIAGFWVGASCIFLAVSNRLGAICGAIAFLALTLTRAEYFASEARAYGFCLGLCGLALLSWQYAVIFRRKRLPALLVLGASLCLLVGSFFLNLFVLPAFALPELYRWFKGKRPDWAVCAAILTGLLPLLIFLPFIKAIMNQSLHVWTSEVPSPGLIYGYFGTLSDSLGLGIIFVAAVTTFCGIANKSGTWGERKAEPPRPEEILLTSGFLLIPVLVVLATHFAKTYCDPRYTLTAVFGIVMAVAGLAWMVSRAYPRFALIAAGVLFLLFVRLEVLHVKWKGEMTEAGLGALRGQDSGDLIFVNDPYSFMRMWHTWPEADRQRLRYAYDLGLAASYTGQVQLEFNMKTLEPRSAGAILPYSSFRQSRDEVLLYCSPADHGNGWLQRKLLEEHAMLRLIGKIGDDFLFEVKRSAPTTLAASRL